MSMTAMIETDGLRFRDLDHDGRVAPYEDWRRTPAERTDDLLGRLTLEEKVGLMLHGTAAAVGGELAHIGVGTGYDLDAASDLVLGAGVSSVITRLRLPPRELAEQNNALQALAARGRLGIPVTISTDPRNHVSSMLGASVDSSGFSQWPGTLGLGAIGDVGLVRRFGDVVRQEYRAVGIHTALSPQADLATEPRWPRIDGTFGADPGRVRALVGAFVEGLQCGTGGLTTTSVAAVVKHWVGYGASRDGFDGHNYYGRFSAFPDDSFDDHVAAFLDAFAVGVAGVMPTYNILEGVTFDGAPLEAVGGGFSAQLLTGLLRGVHGFAGLIVSDWAITRDSSETCRTGVPPQTPSDIAMPWGVEHLPRVDRVAKGVNAGLDQIGGENDPGPLLQAVRDGLVATARIDESVRRVLVQKFELGLFDAPFVDVDQAAEIVGCDEFRHEAERAQRRSVTVLHGPPQAVVIRLADRVYLHGYEPDAFVEAGVTVVGSLGEATVAVVRLATPFEVLHPGFFFGRMQHEGDLDFKDGDAGLEALRTISSRVPTVVVVHMDRPAILANVVDEAKVLIAAFGVADGALVAALLDPSLADGRLPFDLPSSMASVLRRAAGEAAEPVHQIFHRA
jgi:beta-glucosidase